MRKWAVPLLFAIPCSLLAGLDSSEEEFSKRIVALLLVKDHVGAMEACKTALKIFPRSDELKSYLVRVLAENGQVEEALKFFKAEFAKGDLKDNFSMIETLAWSVLSQDEGKAEMTKVASLVGAHLTHDARTISLLLDALHSTNALMRSFGIKFASSYNDRILQKEILYLLKEEKNWFVRQSAIEAAGAMRIKEAKGFLKEIIANRMSTDKEKATAIQSLVRIYDRVENRDIQYLIKHKLSGLRCLGIALLDHFEKVELLPSMLHLVKDPNQSALVMFLGALGSLPVDAKIYQEIEKDVVRLTHDANYEIAMIASWLSLKFQEQEGRRGLKRCILLPDPLIASRAAAILGSGGAKVLDLVETLFEEVEDPYVKANLAIGMIKLSGNVEKGAHYLHRFLTDRKEKLTWDKGIYPMFTSLVPSEVRHVAHIPRYPELVDQFTRLELVNMLCMVSDVNTKGIVKDFLRGQIWGVSGTAAALVLEEGDLKAIEIVRELLNDDDEKIRLQAALALAFYGKDHSTVKILEEAYAKMDWDNKVNILEALGSIGDRESIPFLLNVMEEPFQLLRTISASSVIQCLYH